MDAINNLVKLYANKNVLREAIERFEECLSRGTQELAIFNFLGVCYQYIGEDNKAREMQNKSLALGPNQEEIVEMLGVAP
jgi:Flp pilus assembly protein TadD